MADEAAVAYGNMTAEQRAQLSSAEVDVMLAGTETEAQMPPPNAAEASALAEFESSIHKQIERAVRDGRLDYELLDRWEDVVKQGAPVYYSAGQADGVIAGWKGVVSMLDDPEAARELAGRIDRVAQGADDPHLMGDIKSAFRSQGGRPASGASPADRERARIQAGLRQQRYVPTVAEYQQMTPAQRRQLSSEQIDAMTARETGGQPGSSGWRRHPVRRI